MAFETKQLPYEFLVRWDDNGVLQGAHVSFRHVTRDNGQKKAEGIDDPIAVGINGSEGFPLSDILDQTTADAIAAANVARAQAEELKRLLQSAETAVKEAGQQAALAAQQAAEALKQRDAAIEALALDRSKVKVG